MMKNEKRNYGHDSIVQSSDELKKSNIKFKDIVKFNFDNALSKTKNFIIFLILLSAMFGLIMMVLQYFFLPETNKLGFDRWWGNFTKLLGIGAGDTWADRFINFLFWAMSVIISGSVIGFIAKGISNITEYLKKGRSKVIVDQHILILGWSNNIYALISELLKANSNIKEASIVIFSSLENQKMQDLLKTNLPNNLRGKIITRNGDISNPKELRIVNPAGAKSVIIMQGSKPKDLDVKMSLMALYSYVAKSNKPIIVQIQDQASLQYLNKISDINLIPVYDYDVLVKVCSQSIRQQGIGSVVLDFMDFDGNEVYYYEAPSLVGKSYMDSLLSFSDACVIGIYTAAGQVLLNPEKSHIIEQGDKMILVAEDDDKISLCPKIDVKPIVLKNNDKNTKAGNILFIGWSSFANSVMNNFIPFRNSTQQVFVTFDDENVNDSATIKNKIKSEYGVEVIDADSNSNFIQDIINNKQIDSILILPYTDKLTSEESDTLTLLKILELNNYNKAASNKVRVIAYLLDSSKSEIASFTETEELIISDNLSSLLIAQYSENPHLLPLFEDIFDAEGASISLVDAFEIVNPDTQYTFADIVYQGALKGYSVFGIRQESKVSNGVLLNPPKSDIVTLKQQDKIIVI